MPYTAHLVPRDLGGFIDIGAQLNGTFVNITPSSATDTATATKADAFNLVFTMATPPPPGAATLYVGNSGPTGDLFRSGLFTGGLPPSPGDLTVLSFPTTYTSMSPTAFATAVSTGVGTIPLTPPAGLVAVVAAASLGAYIPQGGAITGVVPDLTTNPGEVTLTVTGFFNFRVYYFFTDTITFTATIPVTIAPSGDASRPSRILSVTTGTITLSIFTTGPSPTLALLGLIRSLRGPVMEALIQPQIGAALESFINDEIDKQVAPAMASMGLLRSPTSVVSARNVTITSSGVRLELVLADLFGPAFSPVSPPPGNLHAQVSPTPQAGGQRLYTVTVTDTATSKPVNQANVTLLNYATGGIAQIEGPRQTDANGNPQPPFNVALEPNVTWQIDPITQDRIRIFHPPILTVSKTGYNTINLRLLEDTSDF